MPTSYLPSQRLRLVAIAVVFLAGIGGTVALYRFALAHDELRRTDEINRQIDHRHALIREALNGYEESLHALTLLFTQSDEIDRREFHAAAASLIARHPGVFSFVWVPRVPADERAAWAVHGLGAGEPPLALLEHRPDGSLAPAGDRPEYFPIRFAEPARDDWNPIGCDLAAGPLQATLTEARRTRAPTMSGRLGLLLAHERRDGVILASPVFAAGDPAHFRGFVLSVFQLDQLLARSWTRFPGTFADALFIDENTVEVGQRELYFHRALPDTSGTPTPTEAALKAGPHRQLPLAVGGRQWHVLYRPELSLWPHSRLPGLLLISGLVITGLMTAFLARSARHTHQVEHEVADRTAELSESRRQLDALVQSLPGMAYRCRYDRHLTILYLSEGARALTGCEPGELISGQTLFRQLIHPEDQTHARQATLDALLRDRGPFEVTYRIRLRNGQEKWVLSRGRGSYSPDGQLLFFEGLAIDITAQKQAEHDKLAIERKLLEAQKLESLGLLAGGIAHDFNNLLAGIIGNANLARIKLGENPVILEHIGRIETGGARAAELCQQMLAYSGKSHFVVESADLNRLVQDTLPLIQGSIPTHARLDLALAPTPQLVLADTTQIRQIVMNLIINAADAIGRDAGVIRVATGTRQVGRDTLLAARGGDALQPGPYLFLEVTDTGCGMTPETLSRIFDPFFTTKFTGRGLGLAAVLNIVRSHAGALRVVSELGRGSTFTLLLPTAEPAATATSLAPEPATATPWRRHGKVLVVDDEGPVRDVAAELLRTYGLTVVTATDGTDGIARFTADPAGYDLVFLDLTMPGLDGEETLAALRAVDPAVRVLLVSGYSEGDRLARLAGPGPLGFLQKPFTRRKLEAKLREIFA